METSQYLRPKDLTIRLSKIDNAIGCLSYALEALTNADGKKVIEIESALLEVSKAAWRLKKESDIRVATYALDYCDSIVFFLLTGIEPIEQSTLDGMRTKLIRAIQVMKNFALSLMNQKHFDGLPESCAVLLEILEGRVTRAMDELCTFQTLRAEQHPFDRPTDEAISALKSALKEVRQHIRVLPFGQLNFEVKELKRIEKEAVDISRLPDELAENLQSRLERVLDLVIAAKENRVKLPYSLWL